MQQRHSFARTRPPFADDYRARNGILAGFAQAVNNRVMQFDADDPTPELLQSQKNSANL
jgi:hypothetical protein